MAPGSSRRRRRTETDEEDEDSMRYGRSSHSIGSPKRPRLDTDQEEDQEDEDIDGTMHTDGAINGNDTDGFQPGAIVRVKVQNFVTYEEAEFFPGPHLNMVVGPNGTGKSSLVCAICLGLGYGPKHLGRAGSVKEFVKHGKETATIEIELQKRPKDRRNFIVQVKIRREQNNQKWWLNGEESNHKSIQALMRKLKIQVDNLCQFLPQDRVVEFAACTPVDLLHETLRAAAPEEMLHWQKQLQGLHREKKELAEASHTDAETLRNLVSRQQGLQAEVDRMREREEIQEQVQNLEAALVLAQYKDARDTYTQAKERRKEAEKALKRLEDESGPSLEAINSKQLYAQQIEVAISERNQALQEAEEKAEKLARDVETAAEEVREFDNRIEAEKKSFDTKRKEVASCKTKITALQADLKKRPEDFNAGEFNRQIRAEEHKLRDIEAEHRELLTQSLEVKARGKQTISHIQKIDADMESFDTQQGQQLNFMKKTFPEIADGWEWVQQHQDEFEKEVFGPPMISCSIKDERYSNLIQSLLQSDDFTCFVAQTKNDYKKLADQLYRVMSLSVVIRTCAQPLEAFRAPLDAAGVEQYGLDGFAIDYLDGPAPVLAMLCAEKRLHLSGVSHGDHNDTQYERLLQSGKVNQWAAGKQSFMVKRRREYGPQAMTTITKNILPGKFWTSQPVDSQEKEEMKRRLDELRDEKGELREQLRELQDKLKAMDGEKNKIYDNINKIKSEKSSLQRELQKWQSLPEKIESEERAKSAHEEALREARKNIARLLDEWDAAVFKRETFSLRHKKATDRIGEALQALLDAEIRLIEARSDIQGLKDRNADIIRMLEAEKQTVQEAVDEADRARSAGRQLTVKVQELLVEVDDEKKTLLTQLAEGKTAQDIQIEIDAEEAKLELIHASNPNVIREFERRSQEIARLTTKMEGSNETLRRLNGEVEELMGKWEPRLEELVSKINDAFAYNFEQISCAGEVRIRKAEDFDAWALDIMVRFREDETLQQLNAHRQSGGERAVSTIFFLMALQSMAQSPFRVVDEINQGMDPRNERMVHERMVEIACREHTSQYFLITPKLLTGLRYDPKMRILCIASGEHMPREGQKLDFARCLRVQKSLMAAG